MDKTLIEKLISIQSELKAPKGHWNDYGGYHYRSCEDILEALKPMLAAHGLIITLDDEMVEVGERIYVKATAAIGDGVGTIATHAFAREPESKKGMDSSQITGCASSYARKYALNGLFAIDDTADADTMDNRGQGKPAVKPAAKPEQTSIDRLRKAVMAYATATRGELSLGDRAREIMRAIEEQYKTTIEHLTNEQMTEKALELESAINEKAVA